MATTADSGRIIAVYEGVMLALDLFETDSATERSIYCGPSRLDLLRSSAGRIVITRLWTYPLVRSEGCASAALRALCDFADLLGWTVVVEPAYAVGGDPSLSGRLFERFGFGRDRAAAGVLFRLPG